MAKLRLAAIGSAAKDRARPQASGRAAAAMATRPDVVGRTRGTSAAPGRAACLIIDPASMAEVEELREASELATCEAQQQWWRHAMSCWHAAVGERGAVSGGGARCCLARSTMRIAGTAPRLHTTELTLSTRDVIRLPVELINCLR